ncbi:hypothetical protein [Paenibacillus sp. sgz302251]|uniref:hypothetical protein n=1 Tax=Paenibacillus sp. sgz302251 TaxID=3414493 RepID=UPI003C7B9F7E
MIKIVFLKDQGYIPQIQWGDGAVEKLTIRQPIIAHYMDQTTIPMKYGFASQVTHEEWQAEMEWMHAGYQFTIKDRWIAEENRVVLHRQLKGLASQSYSAGGGLQLQLQGSLLDTSGGKWRFCSPATHYSEAGTLDSFTEVKVFMEDRLTYPVIVGYQQENEHSIALGRVKLPETSSAPRRTAAKESKYLQETEVGSLGYAVAEGREVILQAFWPYHEGDQSVALDSKRSPVSAFYPLEGESFEMELAYDFRIGDGDTFADAVYSTFKSYAELNTPKPVKLPFTLEQSIDFRNVSLRSSYRELANGGAGFFFHFDPRHGYLSEPSGFGTSFNNIPHESYTRILEYGFTGRQINTAYTLAKSDGGEWIGRGRRVTQFFVDRLSTPTGFLYSLFDIEKDEPFASFGQADAPKLHYISHGNIPGNYLRTMVEPAYDLLLNYQLYASLGMRETSWWDTTLSFANFLLKHQNKDGSWYRAYEPDGTPLKNAEGFGNDEFSSKSASSIPILYLIAIGKACGEDGQRYFDAARQAGDYVLSTYVSKDHYLGGTLDNPNVIDKEAGQYTMAALYGLYKLTGDDRYLQGAVRAGKIFVTWNYIWNAPHLPGTDLARVQFQTVGMGGINSIWGGGVVDIYSLFHIEELDLLGAEIGEDFFCSMAEWIAIGTQQMLSHPGDLMGFVDLGMQPEGFGICNQGIDEGMIAKGDIWGTLGWIYSAGIYGLGKYLENRSIHKSV